MSQSSGPDFAVLADAVPLLDTEVPAFGQNPTVRAAKRREGDSVGLHTGQGQWPLLTGLRRDLKQRS